MTEQGNGVSLGWGLGTERGRLLTRCNRWEGSVARGTNCLKGCGMIRHRIPMAPELPKARASVQSIAKVNGG
jgi:hypothetical protein